MHKTDYMQFIVKVTKFCNLRCTYCYEYNELSDRRVISHENMRQIYENIGSHLETLDQQSGSPTEIRFIWHGGEPLTMPVQYYYDTFDIQAKVFSKQRRIKNIVQTNLTILDNERISLLKRFDGVGISIDLFGGLRKNISGKDMQAIVLRNMEKLTDAGIAFGCIVVLTAKNIAHIEEIFAFFEKTNLPLRILPLFDSPLDMEQCGVSISTQAIISTYRKLIDLWLQSNNPPDILPLSGYIRSAISYIEKTKPAIFDKSKWDPAIIVNTNGDCYHTGDPFGDPEWCLGNLIESTLHDILSSANAKRSFREADQRIADNCTQCKYFGACSGYPIVEELQNIRERTQSGRIRCVVEKAAIEHIEHRLRADPQLVAHLSTIQKQPREVNTVAT